MFNLEVKNGKGKDEELVRPIWLHVIPLKLILEVLRQLLPVYDSDLYYTQTFGNRMRCASSSIYSEVQRTLLDEKSSVPKRKYLQIGPCSTCSSHVCARERKSLYKPPVTPFNRSKTRPIGRSICKEQWSFGQRTPQGPVSSPWMKLTNMDQFLNHGHWATIT